MTPRNHQLVIAALNYARAQRQEAHARPGRRDAALTFTSQQRETFKRVLALTPADVVARIMVALVEGEEAA